MNTIDIIKDLCKKKGISLKALEKELEYSNGSLAKAKVIPSDRILELSKYFDVSMEYLMTGEEKEKEGVEAYYLNDETAKTAQEIYENDKILFDVYRSADKNRLIEYAKKLMELRKMEEGDD